MSTTTSRKLSDQYAHDPLGPVVWPGHAWLKRGVRILVYVSLTLLALLFLFPLFWMTLTSLKGIDETLAYPPIWAPSEWRWENYVEVTQAIPFWTYTVNTIILCVLNVLGTLISCSLVAYGFSRIQWPGRDRFFMISLATMMVPFPVLMVPLYSMFLKLGWIGSLKPLWIPAFFGTAYNIFLLRQFFLSIPEDLSDAARMDGAGEWRIFWRVVMPLSRPPLLVVGLFSFLYVWNDFIGPLVYLHDRDLYTLSLGLYVFHSGTGDAPFNLLMAATTLIVLPVIVLFFLFQDTFLKGISLRNPTH